MKNFYKFIVCVFFVGVISGCFIFPKIGNLLLDKVFVKAEEDLKPANQLSISDGILNSKEISKLKNVKKTDIISNPVEEEIFMQNQEKKGFDTAIAYLVGDYELNNIYGGICHCNGVEAKSGDVIDAFYPENINGEPIKVKKVEINFYKKASLDYNCPEKVDPQEVLQAEKFLEQALEDSGAMDKSKDVDKIATWLNYLAKYYFYDLDYLNEKDKDKRRKKYIKDSFWVDLAYSGFGICSSFAQYNYKAFKKLGIKNYVVYMKNDDEVSKESQTKYHATNRIFLDGEYKTIETSLGMPNTNKKLYNGDSKNLIYYEKEGHPNTTKDITLVDKNILHIIQIRPGF